LPCADFISDTEHFEHSELFRRIFNGFVKVAFEYGCRVEVLPVSPTNNDEDIDWSKLEHLNSHSMVFVSSFWYHKIFPLLRERNCKVVMLDFQDPDRKYYDDDVRGWSTIVCRQDEMAKDAVRFLAALGNRKIAIMRRCLNEENHPSLRGYLEGLEVSGLKNAIWRDASVTGLEYKDAAKMINDFYRQTNFDALILDTGVIRKIQFTSSVNRCLGLPENVDILMTTDPERNCHLFPALSSCDFPYEEIGRLGARRLLGHEPGGASPEIRGHIVERESTGKKTAVFTARGSIAFNGINNNVVSIK
jgi:DNA-binding LacI/PurR family transcriptional regulator